ncbi:helix-turn-helix transcriptional regulator [Clostridium septicum]|uniref:WYL domain-containing protein n=1 Tax=Clostridium septicum TaxID=1504 RepID=A0A9N7JJJ0_CLOSE|nr:WYL domain-containing protein [Clostridium septicum]AYE33260.1 WYL domain-containing protein [Clostridium septicum]MDU1313008.1 WYL domain-containing protein [Clostridium septicum]QAS61431.1 WYL domain-containing protein [Clostridium septicum]UEC22136.1 WYL domain-containing protein [Clostridium septicum]USR99834.1 WYL domain-containing protein [Clostridium septicum]
MSSLGNLLKMLYILKRGQKVKVKDLAEELEVDHRQIRRYKEELSEYFDIQSITGPNGGYILCDEYFPFKDILTEKEINNLKRAIDTVSYSEEYELGKAIDKINFTILNSQSESLISEQIIPYSRPKMEIEKINKMYNEINLSILSCKEIIIVYVDNKGSLTRRAIQPHKFLRFKGEYYIIATCKLRNEIRYFKLVRIKEYILTEKRFEKMKNIDELINEYKENSIGIFGGNEIEVELEINPPMANTIKERIWVDNQEVIELEDGKILFKAIMKLGPELISWVLSMGDSVKINSSEELKRQVRIKVENIFKNL